MLLLLLACAHRPVPTEAGGPMGQPEVAPTTGSDSLAAAATGPVDPCTASTDLGADKYNAGKTNEAVRIWTEAYTRCGAGYGLLAHQAIASAKLEHFDEAAGLVLRELGEAHPSPLALKLLIALKGKVSVETSNGIYNLGRSPEAAIFIPDLQGEYAWMRFLVCGGKEEALKQSLATGPDGPLDEMQFVCPGSSTPQTLYFEYRAP